MDDSRIALSFDVEDLYDIRVGDRHKLSIGNSLNEFSDHKEGMFDCLSEPFFKVMRLLEKNNITATFFVVSDILERYPQIAATLRASSHEIGCHSLHHSIPVNPATGEQIQPLHEWEKDLIISKNTLEEYFDREVLGYRAPAGYFCNWMVEILLRNGFKYDSSVASNILYNKTNIKTRNIPSRPYFIDPATLGQVHVNYGLVELPWSTLEVFGKKFPAGGAFFYRLLGNAYFSKALSQCLRSGDTMIYMHLLDFSSEIFLSQQHWKRRLYWVGKGFRSFNNFSRLLEIFRDKWTTCADVYERFNNSLVVSNIDPVKLTLRPLV